MTKLIDKFDPHLIETGSGTLFESKTLSLNQILASLSHLDTDPPYQRGEVWKKEYKEELVRSIFRGVPINTLHLVKKDEVNGHLRWVLDGKQRIDTLKAFVNNTFSVNFNFNGDKYNVKWKDITNPGHLCYPLYSRLNEFQCNVVIWNTMSLTAQRDVFLIINYSKSLNNEEKIYCENFMVQKMLTEMYERCCTPLNPFLYKKISNNYRFAGIRMLHNLLLLSYGTSLQDVVAERNLSYKSLKYATLDQEEWLIREGVDASKSAIDNVVRLKKIVSEIKMVVSWFERTVQFKSVLTRGKKFDHNVILDVLVFFIKMHQRGIFTNSYFHKDTEKFYKLVCDWVEYKDENANELKKSATHQNSFRKRFDSIQKISESIGFDMSVKNTALTPTDKLRAAMSAGKECPITGAAIGDYNAQFDHVSPKASGSDGRCVVISDVGNRKKSDLTPEVAEKILDYFPDPEYGI